jgi:3-isopropylmalate/(R)-2-methylmalate dehydratase large subunit
MMKPMTFAEKTLARAAGIDQAQAGEILDVRPDRILSHDNTAAIAHIFYEELSAMRVADPEQLCIVLDHVSPPPTPRHAQNHAETRQFVRDQGVAHFYDVGRGISHQVISEEGLVLPGNLILGGDSHTPHFGWLGAFGAGIGRSEVAALWATGHLWLRVPESIKINLLGQLATGVTSKDLCLQISKTLSADGGLYASIEFTGPGLSHLSLESRMVIPNSMAEIGVKTAYLFPDNAVFDYLSHRSGIPKGQIEAGAIYPDEGASYIAEYDLDLDRIEPQIACPHTVDNVRSISEVTGRRVDLAFIGTCTNGRLEDLTAAAAVLRGKHVHPETRLLVFPASSQVYQQALAKGILEVFIEAGAVIGVPGCGPCMGNHLGIPAPGEVVISTANRNFRGRMGQPDADIYLASPAVVAASAVLGSIASPVALGENFFRIDSSEQKPAMIAVKTTAAPESVQQLEFGGNAGVEDGNQNAGKAWKYGVDISTDQIFPGKYTYTLAAPVEIAERAMEDLDLTFARKVQPGDVVFGGSNFGCGSSREQAVTCLKYNGVTAVVAESFGRIFYRNAINQGLPAIVCPQAVTAANPGDPVQIDFENGIIHLPTGRFAFSAFPPNVQAILQAGGLIPFMKAKAKYLHDHDLHDPR